MKICGDVDAGSSCSLKAIILVYLMVSTVHANFSRLCIMQFYIILSTWQHWSISSARTWTKRMQLLTVTDSKSSFWLQELVSFNSEWIIMAQYCNFDFSIPWCSRWITECCTSWCLYGLLTWSPNCPLNSVGKCDISGEAKRNSICII